MHDLAEPFKLFSPQYGVIDDDVFEEKEVFTVTWMSPEPHVEPADFLLIIEDNDISTN